MLESRRRYLEQFQTARLTRQEMAEGWHFCVEYDGMVVGPGMPEQENCLCFKKDTK